MMNADQCRAKARLALANADAASEAHMRDFYVSLADEWQALAASAHTQDGLQRELNARY